MSPSQVTVVAPSRLHAGLFAFDHSEVDAGRPAGDEARAFGGLGVMIAEPAWELLLEPAPAWSVSGPEAARAAEFARRWLGGDGALAELGCALEIRRAAPAHAGLGSGTQLALAVAAALGAWRGEDPSPLAEVARRLGRARRSAVGLYGFASGGLVVEAGRLPGEPLSPLVARVELPPEWRWLLCRPRGTAGISGEREAAWFSRLPPVPVATTIELRRLALDAIVPAARREKTDEFAGALWEYGLLAGECFVRAQGGRFASPRVAQLVAELRQLGAVGVAQSSWGPTVFALAANAAQAEDWAAMLRTRIPADELAIDIVSSSPAGAQLWLDGQSRPLPWSVESSGSAHSARAPAPLGV